MSWKRCLEEQRWVIKNTVLNEQPLPDYSFTQALTTEEYIASVLHNIKQHYLIKEFRGLI